VLERLFGAFNLAAKAMGMSTKELNKALEQGQVSAKEMLPKLIPIMNELANKNGALSKQLETAATAQQRFNLVAQEGADTIFQSGMSDGLKELWGTLTDIFVNAGPQLEKLGKIFGSVFKAIAYSLKVLEPVMKVFIDNFEIMFGAYALSKVATMQKALALFGVSAASSLTAAFLPIAGFLSAIAAIDDWTSSMDIDMTRVSMSERVQGFQTNLYGQRSEIIEKDGKMFKGATTESKGLFGISSLFDDLLSGRGLTPSVIPTGVGTPKIGNVNLTIHGVTNEDIISKIHSEMDNLVTGGMANNGA
tara:strand:+ start:1471 stop:2385 length:915 start_codon:yes stop_codon:yes gene_type:complete